MYTKMARSARKSARKSAKKSARRVLARLQKKSNKKMFVVRGKGSARREVMLGKRTCSPQARKVFKGPNGGVFCMKNGKKHYLKRDRF
jgi:hypothetical protein